MRTKPGEGEGEGEWEGEGRVTVSEAFSRLMQPEARVIAVLVKFDKTSVLKSMSPEFKLKRSLKKFGKVEKIAKMKKKT